MAQTTTTNLSAEMQTYYDKKFLEKVVQNFIHAQFAEKRSIAANSGKVTYFTRYLQPTVDTTALTEGTNPTALQVSAENVSATLQEYGRVWNISSFVSLTAIDPELEKRTDIAADDASGTIDTLVKNEMANATYVSYANSKTAISTTGVTDTLAVAGVKVVVRNLKKRKATAMEDGYFVGIVGPDTAYDLMGDSVWISAHTYKDGDNLYKGEIGKLFGVRFVESNSQSVASASGGASSAKVYNNIFLGKEAIAQVDLANGQQKMYIKTSGPTDTSNPLNMFSTVGWKDVFATKILNNEFIELLRTGATV